MSMSVSKEGNVLFNDALNTFYLRLYCVALMVKYHSYSERGNLLPPIHGYSFRLVARALLYAPSLIARRIAHTMAFVTPGVMSVFDDNYAVDYLLNAIKVHVSSDINSMSQ